MRAPAGSNPFCPLIDAVCLQKAGAGAHTKIIFHLKQ